MLLRLGSLAVPLDSVIAVLDMKAASDDGTAAFFRNAVRGGRVIDTESGPRRSAVLARVNGSDSIYYSSVNAKTLRNRANLSTTG